MILLIPSFQELNLINLTDLNSIMILLIRNDEATVNDLIRNLNSIMILLIPKDTYIMYFAFFTI